jgi:TatD DNase family protein
MIDTHAHLDVGDFDSDRDAVIARARAAGIVAMICPAIDAASSEAVVRLAAAHPDVFAAVGIQPNDTAQASPGDWERIVAMVGSPKVVALGETGLDRYWDHSPIEIQQEFLDRHLRLAQERKLPVILHCREAEADLLPTLRAAVERGPLSGVLHSFSGDAAFAAACLELGLYLSFSGAVTYTNKKFAAIREVAAQAPADRLLIETDCPYLTPHPLRGKEKRNEPANVRLTAQVLADLRGCPIDALDQQTTANARRLFGLE